MKDPGLSDDDLAFERRLLEAGRAEAAPSRRTGAALLRFTAGLAAAMSVVSEGSVATGASSGVVAKATSSWCASAKWLALGALGGSLATLAWLRHGAPEHSVSTPSAPAPTAAQVEPKAEPRQVVDATPGAPVVPTPRPQVPPTPRGAAASASAIARAAPDLAAEVAALDRVRNALSIGAWSEAERQLAEYRSRFAQGAMRREAEVLSLDVLVAQGDKPAAARAAQRFIAQHPRDPQVARMRAFLD